MPIITIKGKKVNQEKLREFLDGRNFAEYQQDDGQWKSPITGELFVSKSALNGHLGAYLRKPKDRLPTDEPSRAGYVRARRAGVDPTPEQKEAHRQYAEWYRSEGRWLARMKRERAERGQTSE